MSFISVEIEINHHCNLACPYCPNSLHEKRPASNMSIELFTEIMKQLSDINYEGKICYHFYNEPLLHPRLVELVAISKKVLPESKSEIYSNGLLLNHEKFNSLISAGVDKFSVTRHKGQERTAFDAVWESLSEKEKAIHRYVDHTKLSYTNRGGLVAFGKEVDVHLQRRPCYIPCSTMVITMEGNVLTCYEDYRQKNIMGNVQQTHLRDIWESDRFTNFRQMLKLGKRDQFEVCSQCNNRLMF